MMMDRLTRRVGRLGRVVPVVTVICLLSLVFSSNSVEAAEKLTVLSPKLFPASNGVIFQRPSLFGLPNFRDNINGQVIYPEATTNNLGCSAYANSFQPPFNTNSSDPDPPPTSLILIALIDRGGCKFAQKVQHAQDAGAAAVIIVNNATLYSPNLPLPYMAADPGVTLNIPAMIISDADGQVLKNNINADGGLLVSMSYFLPNPDDRVEIDFYTSATETVSTKFKTQFRSVVTSMGSHIQFEPHYQQQNYYYIWGTYASGCARTGTACTAQNLNARCGNRCINCGRYCQLDPDGNSTSGASGADVVMEQLRSKCVWQYGNDTNATPNTYWFDYVTKHDAACVGAPSNFDATCSMNLITSLGIPASYITTCLGTNGFQSDNTIPVAEADKVWANTFPQFPPPGLTVNQQPYHGDITCADPIGPDCPPLQMVCAGFADGTQPIACATSPGCALGVQFDACSVCGGDNSTCTGCDGVVKSGKELDACGGCMLKSDPNFISDNSQCPSASSPGSGFPVGAVIGIVLGAVVLIGGGVFLYMRRQNALMKDDIDSLLKQYLPLDGPTSSADERRANRQVDQTRLMSGQDSDETEPSAI